MIEFAFRHTKARIIGVTGTNGKTTTTLLVSHMLRHAGFEVLTAGNIGQSFAGSIIDRDYEIIVLELSSFQLDDIVDFRPDIAIILNITPDHLDRYDNNFKKYAESKLKITENQKKSDVLIYNADNNFLKGISTNAKKLPVSLQTEIKEGAFYKNNQINIKLNNIIMTIQELALQGKHNIFNSMAAAMAARVFEVQNSTIRQSLIDFESVEHRLEYVLTIHGIDFINDSKATNINSCWYALESVKKDVVWIVGGVDKGNDYTQLLDLVEQKVKAIVCLGKDNSRILKIFKGKTKIKEARNMQEAVNVSYSLANSGDTVLLSPACASFDLFANFEERGLAFKAQVRKL